MNWTTIYEMATLQRKTQEKFGIKKKTDYHAVPDKIGKRKEDAVFFDKKWSEKFELATAIYTRTLEGRRILIRARLESLSSSFVKSSEQVSVWK